MDYKATAAQIASVANAIRAKFGGTVGLEFPSDFTNVILNGTVQSGGSEITPQDPTAEYKVTDTQLTAIANAIRTRGETSAQLIFPDEFVSAIGDISGEVPFPQLPKHGSVPSSGSVVSSEGIQLEPYNTGYFLANNDDIYAFGYGGTSRGTLILASKTNAYYYTLFGNGNVREMFCDAYDSTTGLYWGSISNVGMTNIVPQYNSRAEGLADLARYL